MKWIKSKAFFLLLVVLFFSSLASLSAELCDQGWDHSLLEAQDQELAIIFEELETTINEQEKKITSLETSQKGSEVIINEQAISLKEAEKSWQAEKNRQTGRIIIGTGIGALTGWFLYWFFDHIIPLLE